MSNQLFSSLPLLLTIFFFLHSPVLLIAESPAPSPSPTGPPHIASVLKKAGHFNTLIRLLKRTKMDDRIYSLLNDSNPLTFFAPTDDAFSKLPPDTLKTFNYQQKIQLIQFHLLNSLLPFSDFETVSNPLSTQAGDNSGYHYPLNVTMEANQVNITTGVVNATVTGTIYTDNLLAVYSVDRVLLPLRFYVSPPPAPAPPAKPAVQDLSPSVPATKASGAVGVIHHQVNGMCFVGFVIAALALCP